MFRSGGCAPRAEDQAGFYGACDLSVGRQVLPATVGLVDYKPFYGFARVEDGLVGGAAARVGLWFAVAGGGRACGAVYCASGGAYAAGDLGSEGSTDPA